MGHRMTIKENGIAETITGLSEQTMKRLVVRGIICINPPLSIAQSHFPALDGPAFGNHPRDYSKSGINARRAVGFWSTCDQSRIKLTGSPVQIHKGPRVARRKKRSTIARGRSKELVHESIFRRSQSQIVQIRPLQQFTGIEVPRMRRREHRSTRLGIGSVKRIDGPWRLSINLHVYSINSERPLAKPLECIRYVLYRTPSRRRSVKRP